MARIHKSGVSEADKIINVTQTQSARSRLVKYKKLSSIARKCKECSHKYEINKIAKNLTTKLQECSVVRLLFKQSRQQNPRNITIVCLSVTRINIVALYLTKKHMYKVAALPGAKFRKIQRWLYLGHVHLFQQWTREMNNNDSVPLAELSVSLTNEQMQHEEVSSDLSASSCSVGLALPKSIADSDKSLSSASAFTQLVH